MRALAVLALVAGCGNDPPFSLQFRLTPGDTQMCTSDTGSHATDCSEVTMLCDAVVSIRIFPPSDPTAPYISVCKPLTGKKDVCSIAGVDLPAPVVPVPRQRLRVEMAVYPSYELRKDPDGNYLCPTDVAFSANGFPSEETPPCDSTITDPTDPMYCQPPVAIGGSALYSPGDPETVVDLGCINPGLLQDRMTCTGANQTIVNATVNDFDTAVPITPTLADRLAISVGEPKASGSEFVLNPSDTRPLDRTTIQPIPAWSGDVDIKFVTAACLDVRDDSAGSTATLSCVAPMGSPTIDITGIRLSAATLSHLLTALNLTAFPDKGLVIGMVLDDVGNPLPNMTVTPSGMNVSIGYLTDDRQNIVGGSTNTPGVFVSTDAPFGTTFSVRAGMQMVTGIGGLVSGKVTVVILQFPLPVSK